ncbi:MAG TPA: class I tRNA ligase family protein, partial [Flavobacteriaceae bacterium]|nr:class I tRNA ligase family protein [Flavobacteriaceae bacterium]
LEAIKPEYQQPIDSKTYRRVIELFEDNLKILHPFMPFLTEELWHQIKERSSEEALIIAEWPEITEFDKEFLAQFEMVKEVVSNIRKIRKTKNISFKNKIDLKVIDQEKLPDNLNTIILKMGNVDEFERVTEPQNNALSFRIKSNEYFIPMDDHINVEEELEKLEKELTYNQGFLKAVEKKLNNSRFVDNAPEQVVALERQKQADALAKIEAIKEQLNNLK